MRQKVELLAPAGSPEAFYGAVNAGADAVYLAGAQYGARAYADNFTEEELIRCLKYAHLFHKKIYLTVNTLMKEKEMEALPAFLRPYVEEGLDGVIVQDLGVFQLLSETFPDLPLHASTQLSITGVYGANFLKKLGVVRIVPARELSLEEIRTMKRETNLEIECFIHGAICYCYSGNCLFSSILGGRSGNRGRCAQPCRLPYQILDGEKLGKECYPLSLKDMCAIEILPELIEAEIDSFKIEGRMKKPEYAAGVTAIYRKYIDLYYEDRWQAPSQEDLEKLSKLYVRSERTTGYYHQQNGPDMITLSNPAYSGSDEALLGQIRQKYLQEKKKIRIRMKAEFALGRPATLTISASENPSWSVKAWGEQVDAARKAPITRENVASGLSKLGDSAFLLDPKWHNGEPEIYLEDGVFYPLKSINELRRQAINQLEEVISRG